MIHKATFKNFKALRDVSVTFDSRFTVIVGPNGCGKTSVLRGIETAARVLAHRGFQDVFDGTMTFEQIFSGRPGDALVIDVASSVQSRLRGIRISYPMAQDGKTQNAGWRCYTERGPYQSGVKIPYEEFSPLYPAVLLQLSATQLASPSLTKSTTITMTPQGNGLASVLADMKIGGSEDVFNSVIAQFRSIVPVVERVRPKRAPAGGKEEVYGEHLLFDLRGRNNVPASQMSDGSLYILGLITYLAQEGCPKIVLLDDIDHGLHPQAQRDLVGVLRKYLDLNPDLQIVATSHSLYILHQLDPAEVRVMALDDDGAAVCRPLADHPDFPRWKDHMTPGEFWSHVGEKWVVPADLVGAAP